jgi:hypothetical protein
MRSNTSPTTFRVSPGFHFLHTVTRYFLTHKNQNLSLSQRYHHKTMPRFNPQAVAALVDSVPKPTAEQLKGHKALGYGTAGFRAPHFLLESVCLRMGMMVRDSSFQPRPTMMVSFSLL